MVCGAFPPLSTYNPRFSRVLKASPLSHTRGLYLEFLDQSLALDLCPYLPECLTCHLNILSKCTGARQSLHPFPLQQEYTVSWRTWAADKGSLCGDRDRTDLDFPSCGMLAVQALGKPL